MSCRSGMKHLYYVVSIAGMLFLSTHLATCIRAQRRASFVGVALLHTESKRGESGPTGATGALPEPI